MSELPIGVGDAKAQKGFIASHQEFLREFPKIQTLVNAMFTQALENYNQEPRSDQTGSEIPEADQIGLRLAQIIVFYLGRTTFDDFGDLLILAGNGRGIGAKKLIRGMYEHLVTAAFIAQNPAEARAFNDHADVEKGKIWNRTVAIIPEVKNELTPEEVKDLEDRYARAQAKMKSELCKKCGQPVTQEAWTRVAVDSMAAKVDADTGTDLAKLYAFYYLVPTFHAHPTAFGLESRLQKTDAGWVYKELSEPEAHDTVMRGHVLILRLLALLNNYFRLGLDAEVNARREMFSKVWGIPDGQD